MPVPAIAGPLFSSALGLMMNQATNTGNMSLKAQSLLNDQQQEYARENANTEYLKQTQLTSLNPLLQKRGMVNAGMNPSFVNGSSVGAASTVNSTAAPSSGSAPSFQGMNDLFSSGINAASQILQSSGILADNDMKAAGAAKLHAEAEGQNIANKTIMAEAISRINKNIEETRSTSLKNVYQNIENSIHKEYGMSDAFLRNSILGSQAHMAASDASYKSAQNEATLNQTLANIDSLLSSAYVNEEQRKNLIAIREKLIPAQVSSLNAGASLANSQSSLADAQQVAQDIQNAINGDEKVKEAARKNLINLAKEAGPNSFGDYAWSIINDDNATTWQKWKAAGASILGFFERAVGGASETAARNYADRKTSSAQEITHETRISPKGRKKIDKRIIRKIKL